MQRMTKAISEKYMWINNNKRKGDEHEPESMGKKKPSLSRYDKNSNGDIDPSSVLFIEITRGG